MDPKDIMKKRRERAICIDKVSRYSLISILRHGSFVWNNAFIRPCTFSKLLGMSSNWNQRVCTFFNLLNCYGIIFFQSRVPVHIHPAEHHVLAHFRRHSRNYQGRNGYWRRWSLVDTSPVNN